MDLQPSRHRFERVVEALREELAEIIAFELEDPRVDGVQVVDIVADPSLKQVHVNVLTQGTGSLDEAVYALERAKGYLKSQLALRLELRRVPELYFNPASQLGPPKRVESLMKRIRRGRPRG